MIVSIINKSKNDLPKYETLLSAGMDLRASLEEAIIIQPFQRLVVKTGLFISLQRGYEAQIRSRSGLALKKGISVLNSPGTIDADYRGPFGVILINLGSEPVHIAHGDRIAQAVLAPVIQADFVVTETLTDSARGTDGFGSTGKT